MAASSGCGVLLLTCTGEGLAGEGHSTKSAQGRGGIPPGPYLWHSRDTLGDHVRRYRIWVGALHWGQLLLLVPSLLFVGVAVRGGAYLFTDSRDTSAYYAVDKAETALREFREDPFSHLIVRAGEDWIRKDGQRQQLDAALVRAVENAQAAKERMESLGPWVLGVGMFGWAFAWLTAFLSLWWWFGARVKPRGAQ